MRLFWFKMFQSGMDYQLCDIIAIWLVSIMFVINMRNSELKYKKSTIFGIFIIGLKNWNHFFKYFRQIGRKKSLRSEEKNSKKCWFLTFGVCKSLINIFLIFIATFLPFLAHCTMRGLCLWLHLLRSVWKKSALAFVPTTQILLRLVKNH